MDEPWTDCWRISTAALCVRPAVSSSVSQQTHLRSEPVTNPVVGQVNFNEVAADLRYHNNEVQDHNNDDGSDRDDGNDGHHDTVMVHVCDDVMRHVRFRART